MLVTQYADQNQHFLNYFVKNSMKIACFYDFLAENQFLPILCVYFQYVQNFEVALKRKGTVRLLQKFQWVVATTPPPLRRPKRHTHIDKDWCSDAVFHVSVNYVDLQSLCFSRNSLKAWTMFPYFKFPFCLHLLIICIFSDPSYILTYIPKNSLERSSCNRLFSLFQ